MGKNNNMALVGGVAAAGVVYYLWHKKHIEAQEQILSNPVVVPVAGTSALLPGSPPVGVASQFMPTPAVQATPAPVPPAPSQTAQPTIAQMTSALMTQWVPNCKNPPIVAQLVSMLTPDQITGMYNILTTAWELNIRPTPSSTDFWNTLRAQYPCLNTGGLGCSSPTSCP